MNSPNHATFDLPTCHHSRRRNPQTCSRWIAEFLRLACLHRPSFSTVHLLSAQCSFSPFLFTLTSCSMTCSSSSLDMNPSLSASYSLNDTRQSEISVLSTNKTAATILHFNFSSGVPFMNTLKPSTNLLNRTVQHRRVASGNGAATWNLGIPRSLHRRQMHSTSAAEKRRLSWTQSAHIALQTTRDAWALRSDRVACYSYIFKDVCSDVVLVLCLYILSEVVYFLCRDYDVNAWD